MQCLVFPDLFQKNNKDNDGTSQSWSSIRIDTGVQVGGEISIHYDPMIAKLIVHSDSRIHAIDAMKSALAQSGVIGVVTNLGFLQTIIQHSDFAACEIDTLFVESNLESLLSEKDVTADWVYWGAAISCLLVDFEQAALKAQKSMEPSSPWNSLNNWRAGIQQPHRILLRDEQGIDKEVMIIEEKKVYRIINLTDEIYISVSVQGNLLKLKCNSSGMEELVHNLLVLHHESQLLSIFSQGRVLFTRLDSLDFEQIQEKIDFRLSAPMPGNVIRILVKSGEKVNAGQPLLVMEAMKMEHTIVAPVDGIVERVFFKVGDLVENDEKLVKLSTIE